MRVGHSWCDKWTALRMGHLWHEKWTALRMSHLWRDKWTALRVVHSGRSTCHPISGPLSCNVQPISLEAVCLALIPSLSVVHPLSISDSVSLERSERAIDLFQQHPIGAKYHALFTQNTQRPETSRMRQRAICTLQSIRCLLMTQPSPTPNWIANLLLAHEQTKSNREDPIRRRSSPKNTKTDHA